MNLKPIIKKIKSGDTESAKKANNILKKVWFKAIKEKEKRIKFRRIFIRELEKFDYIREEANKIAFLKSLRFMFFFASENEEDFNVCKDFILKVLNDDSARVRQTIIISSEYLFLGLRIDDLWKGKVEISFIEEHAKWFCEFMDEISAIFYSYYKDFKTKKNSRKYKYLSELPPSQFKSFGMLIIKILQVPAYRNVYNRCQKKTKNKIKIRFLEQKEKRGYLKWMECAWKRIPCGKDICKICGPIKQQRLLHIIKGENPDDLKNVFNDIASSFKNVLEMLKKDAGGIENIDTESENIKEPPEPEEFPFYNKLFEWRRGVQSLEEHANLLGEWWIYTEAAADLFWYSNTLIVKTYRQLCNRWHIEQNDEQNDFDYDNNLNVLKECIKILKKSFKDLSQFDSLQKPTFAYLEKELQAIKKQIINI